jgi:dihydroorotate dehydrogenase electron transfer subunit
VTPVRAWAEVRERRPAAEATWWLELEAPGLAAVTRPGQFLMIGLGLRHVGAPFLPRPFSVGWTSPDGRVGLLVRVFGDGTRRLAALRPGDRALLLGPLGRAFHLEPGRPIVCVAGGVGLAPFLTLGRVAAEPEREVRILYGERTAARVFDPDLVRELTGIRPEVFTEDGSLGRRGLVLEGARDGLDPDAMLLGCGPMPMLVALARHAREAGVDLQVSVEEHMGCGIGTCQGCVVRSADGRWVKSCTEGPVFRAEDLAWPT